MNNNLSQPETKRLIVLLPDSLVNNLEVIRKVHWLAVQQHCELVYLTMVDDEADIPLVGCYMDTMRSATATDLVPVHNVIIPTRQWLSALDQIYRPGDQLVCQAEQTVRKGWFGTQPVHDYLKAKLDMPVIVLSGIYHPAQQQAHTILRELVAWLVFMVIIAFFSWLEIQIDPMLTGWLEKLVLSITVVVEIGMLWAWNTVTKG